MPWWLEDSASFQLISIVVNMTRSLLGGTAVGSAVRDSVSWSLGIFAVFAVIAVYRYGKAASS